MTRPSFSCREMSAISASGAFALMVICAFSGRALNFVPVAPVGVNARSTAPAGFTTSELTILPSVETRSFGLVPGSRNWTSNTSIPLSVFLLISATSPFGYCARTALCTAGGSSLNFSEAFSTLLLQPTKRPKAATIVIPYLFINYLLSAKNSRFRSTPQTGVFTLFANDTHRTVLRVKNHLTQRPSSGRVFAPANSRVDKVWFSLKLIQVMLEGRPRAFQQGNRNDIKRQVIFLRRTFLRRSETSS